MKKVLLIVVLLSSLPVAFGQVLVNQWGSNGVNDGQFRSPSGIALDSVGNVYVVDSNSVVNRVQKFTNTGTFLTKWGSTGSGNGQFNSPMDVIVDNADNVFVTDFQNYRVQKFSNIGTFLTKWGEYGDGDGDFMFPRGLGTDSSGNVYVADMSGTIGGVPIASNNRIQKFSGAGAFLAKFGSYGIGYYGVPSGNGLLNRPSDVAVDSTGNMFIADTNNNRVQKLSSSGAYITQFGNYGSPSISSPYAIAVDSAGDVYVGDGGNPLAGIKPRILKYSNSGQYITKWNTFSGVSGIAVDNSGKVYVTSGFGVQVYDMNQPGVCGDNYVQGAEDCDDGNTISGDCCSSTCAFEPSPMTYCDTGSIGACSEGYTVCAGSVRTCVMRYPPSDEQCDQIDNDCDGQIDENACVVCGNSIVETGEQCDDGNQNDGDGCTHLCQFEVCGNGVVEPLNNEQCDDGNLNAGDGCSATCRFEGCENVVNPSCAPPGSQNNFNCPLVAKYCSSQCQCAVPPVCGNSVVDADEQCDDGNTANGDGCSSTCVIEVRDSDNDGVLDDVDACAGTTPDPMSLVPNNHKWDGTRWVTVDAKSKAVVQSSYTIAQTKGCSCAQILAKKSGKDTGELKYGCTKGTMDNWVKSRGWAGAAVLDLEGGAVSIVALLAIVAIVVIVAFAARKK